MKFDETLTIGKLDAQRRRSRQATRASMAREIEALHAAAAAEREAGKVKEGEGREHDNESSTRTK